MPGRGCSTGSTSIWSPGQTVALVGRSGAGKSTLADVLLRFLPYQAGSVTLDGVEISDLDGDDYRRVVGLVSQDAHIFDTTLEENLRLARRDATPAELDAGPAARSPVGLDRKGSPTAWPPGSAPRGR